MDKLYKVELKGIGEIIADLDTLGNLKYTLDQAYTYCCKMSEKMHEQKCYTLSTLYELDKANIEETTVNIIKLLQKEGLK